LIWLRRLWKPEKATPVDPTPGDTPMSGDAMKERGLRSSWAPE
jgi:hypothetical protein